MTPAQKLDYLRKVKLRLDLEAQLEERAVASGFGRYRHDPASFVIDVLHASPDAWQVEVLGAVGAGKHVAVRSGHGVGKTTLLAWLVIWWLCTRSSVTKVPCTATTEDQLKNQLWPEISSWIDKADLAGELLWTKTHVASRRSPETVFAVMKTATRVESLAGFHADNLLFVVDEASGLAEELWPPVKGALSTDGALLCMVGNPTRGDGYFARRFTEDDPAWHCSTVNAEDVDRVTPESIQAWADEFGRDSDVYRVRVLGLPPIGEADGFISGTLVREAMTREMPAAEGRLEIGVDVARYGDDKSAIVIRRGLTVVHMSARHGLSNPAVAGWALSEVEARIEPGERAVVRVDDSGVGGGVTDLLRQRTDLPLDVVACNFGGEGDKWYSNATGRWWANVRRLLQDGMALPANEDLARQLTDRLYVVNAKGKIVLEQKEHMKARGVRSPDLADAFVLAFDGGGHPKRLLRYVA